MSKLLNVLIYVKTGVKNEKVCWWLHKNMYKFN